MGSSTIDPTDYRLTQLVDILQAVDGLSLPLALTLAAIAREPGLSVNDLADRLDFPQQSASRYTAILLGRYESPSAAQDTFKTPFISLEVSPTDPRKWALFLTQHGTKRLASILNLVMEKRK